MALVIKIPGERGQSITLFALMLPLMAVFILGLFDYMTTNARAMEASANQWGCQCPRRLDLPDSDRAGRLSPGLLNNKKLDLTPYRTTTPHTSKRSAGGCRLGPR